MKATHPPLHGLMAEFLAPDGLLAAARAAHEAGYRRMDAYSPLPVEGLADAIGFHRNRMPLVVLCGGVLGGCFAYFMQWYSAVLDYPLNIGGRPLHSWPSFIPITFEVTVLGAGVSAVVGMLALNGLPRPYHPVFNVTDFRMASRNRFFLCIQADDPKFDREETRRFLLGLSPHDVAEVEN
jgi:hypothetical protein